MNRSGMAARRRMDHRHIGELRAHCKAIVGGVASTFGARSSSPCKVGLPWTVMLAARSMAEAVVDIGSRTSACQLLGSTEALSELFGYLPTDDERGWSTMFGRQRHRPCRYVRPWRRRRKQVHARSSASSSALLAR